MKVPVYERQVSDAGAAKFRQNVIDTSAAQYNALRAQQYGEAQLIHGVTQFNNAIKQMSDDFQEAQVADKLAEGMRRKQEVMFADGTGLIHAQGSDAAGMADRAVAECKKIDEELTKGMSQWQMDRYKKASENVNSSFAGSAFRTESARMQEYREEKGKQLLSAGSAMFASGGSMEAQEDTLRQYCSTVGLALSDENLNKARRVMLAGGLDMVAAKDPVAACNKFEEIKSVFPEGDREVIRQKLEKAALPVKYDMQAGELYSKHGLTGYGAAIEEIEKSTPEGADRDGKISALSQLYALKSRVAKEEMGNAETEILALCYDKNSRSEAMKYAAAMGAKFEKEYGNAGREWRIMQQDSVDRIFGTGRHAPKSGGSQAVIFQRGAAQRWCVKNVPGFLGMEPAQQEAAMRKKVGITDQDYQDTKAVLTSQYITGLIGREEISNACTNLYMTREDVNRAEILKRTVGTNLKNTVSDLESDIDKCFFGSKGASVNIRGVANKMTQKDAIAAKNIFRNEVFSIYTSGIDLTSEKVYEAIETAQKKAMAEVISRKGNLKSRFGFTTDVGKAIAAIQKETSAVAAPKLAVKAPKKKGVELQNALMAK